MPGLLALPLQAALAVVVVYVLTILTALAVSRCLTHDDREGAFWYGFTGGFASLGAIIAGIALVPPAAPVIGLAGMLGVGLAGGWLWRGEQERIARRRRTQVEHARAALRARHESVLQRWVSYELDPAVAIDYPDMTNLKRPETAQLVRSMRNAAALREQSPENDDDAGAPGYETAVRELETAFEKAERAAGARTRK
ncbi:hypothetical protein GCM10027403_36390 [Arthrobacter tecti]